MLMADAVFNKIIDQVRRKMKNIIKIQYPFHLGLRERLSNILLGNEKKLTDFILLPQLSHAVGRQLVFFGHTGRTDDIAAAEIDKSQSGKRAVVRQGKIQNSGFFPIAKRPENVIFRTGHLICDFRKRHLFICKTCGNNVGLQLTIRKSGLF